MNSIVNSLKFLRDFLNSEIPLARENIIMICSPFCFTSIFLADTAFELVLVVTMVSLHKCILLALGLLLHHYCFIIEKTFLKIFLKLINNFQV